MSAFEHKFSFDRERGTYSVTAGAWGLSGASVQVLLEDRDLDSAQMLVESVSDEAGQWPQMGAGRVERIVFDGGPGIGLELEAFTPDDRHCVLLRMRLTNRSQQPMRVLTLQPLVVEGEGGGLELGGPRNDWTVLREGWHSWSASGPVRLAEALESDEHPWELGPELQGLIGLGSVTSDRVTLVQGSADDSPCLLAGWLDNQKYFGSVVVGHAQLRALALTDWAEVAPGEVLETSPLVLLLGSHGPPLLEWYGEQFGRRMQALPYRPEVDGSPAEAKTVSGWLSWYSGLGSDISAERLSRNLQQYQSQAERWRLRSWVIDDGWQSVAGDWLTVNHQRFPQGMKQMADEIRRCGLEPGLWVAPFMVSQASMLAREHPDWLMRDEGGELLSVFNMPEESHWRGRQYVLDVTHPQAAEYVAEVVRTMVRQWGFSLIKADFLFVIAVHGLRHDMSLSRCEVMRRGLEILRREMGERFLLGCGCPLGPAVGVVDAMRIGPDVAEHWHDDHASSPATGNAVRNTIARYWQHNRLYMNDADALMVRQVETQLNLEEVRTLATVVAMSGGLMMWSDVLDSVSEDRRLILDKVLPVWPHAARPVDLMHSTHSTTLHWRFVQGDSQWDVVALVNLSDYRSDMEISLADLGLSGRAYHVFELWRERYHGRTSRNVVIRGVPAHGVRVVALRPAEERLCFLGSTLHVTMDAFFCQVQERGLACDVSLSNRYPRRGRLFLWAPEGYVVHTSSGQLTPRRDGSWSIEVDTETVTDYNFEAIRGAAGS